GNDVLEGGTGTDTTVGGTGNDVHIVDNAADVVIEATGGGTDRVHSSVDYALAAGVDIEFLTTTSTSGTDAVNLRGNELAQFIDGNNGINTLEGGGGNDRILGRGGNDT
ncbi:calcium-binding protein, partial [Altererythrobacter sp. SALINAS58]|nr:calcium-binding protein [Alteripontixanthobacter muriae]